MTRLMKFGGWAAALVLAGLTVVYGPFVAACAAVGSAFVVMGVLMAMTAIHTIDDWRLDHPLTPHRRRTHAK